MVLSTPPAVTNSTPASASRPGRLFQTTQPINPEKITTV
jgi:hypothetical protein